MKEAMRLHPGVGMPLERVVPEGGATLCGEFIPGGTIVGVNAWVVHHSKEVFGFDTDTFRPERWLDAEPDQLRLMEQSSFAVSSMLQEMLNFVRVRIGCVLTR